MHWLVQLVQLVQSIECRIGKSTVTLIFLPGLFCLEIAECSDESFHRWVVIVSFKALELAISSMIDTGVSKSYLVDDLLTLDHDLHIVMATLSNEMTVFWLPDNRLRKRHTPQIEIL